MARGGGGIGPNTYIGPETTERAREFVRAAVRNAHARKLAADEQRQREEAEGRQHPVDWILEHFRIPETKDRKLHLGAYQEWVLRRILTPNEDGTWRYGTIIWSDIKKSVKSTLAAAVALYIGSHSEYGSIYIIANDLKQADSRVAYYLRRAIELNPKKFGNVRVTGRRILWPNGTFAEAIPIDPSGEAGSNADLVIFSELWGAHSKAQQNMWTEMTLSPTKYGRSMRWIETYAGHTGEAPLLEQLYDQGAAGASLSAEAPQDHHWGGADLPVWQIPDARLLMLWNDTPRLPWQTPAYYREEAALLLPREFLRVHRNQWVTSEEAFVPIEWWDACGDLDGDPLDFPADTRLVLAADASVTGDTTGLLGVSRHPDKPDHVIVRLTASWQPTRARPMDYDKTLIPKIEDAVGKWNVLELAYDAYQLHQSMVRLRRKGTVWCRAFDQNAERLKADKALYDMIRERRVHFHRGHHGVLRQHILNANAKTGGPDAERMRIVKRANKDPVDLAVTLSMACHEALRLSL